MKKLELKPTDENLLKTMTEDSIGRNSDLFYFVKLINGLDNNYSISLDGPWGSGKTFFVKQAKLIFDAFNDFLDFPLKENFKEKIKTAWSNINNTISPSEEIQFEPQVAVYYDAWANDNDDDPVVSIVYSIIQQLKEFKDLSLPSEFLNVVATIIDCVSNRDTKKILESVRKANALSDLIIQKDLEDQINEFLNGIPVERGNRVIIYIDELDRCNPVFAIRLLERIKHYFTNDRFTFVFSTNVTELEHTIKIYYGDYFDASKYLDRFFDLRLVLQPVQLNRFFPSISFYEHSFLDRICAAIIKKNNFQMREICKFILFTKTAIQNDIDNRRIGSMTYYNGDSFVLLFVIPITISLRIANTEKYNRFLKGEDASPFFDIIDYSDYDVNLVVLCCAEGA